MWQRFRSPILSVVVAVGVWGCASEGGADAAPADGADVTDVPAADPGVPEGATPASDPGGTPASDPGSTPDAGPVATDPGVLDTTPADLTEPIGRPDDVCAMSGLARVAFVAEGGGHLFGDVATDFEVRTVAGSWKLSEQWSGCESYIFFAYPGQGASQSDVLHANTLWRGAPMDLLDVGPNNAQYFFVSDEEEAEARAARMDGLRQSLEAALEAVPDEAGRAFWRGRFHLVTDRLSEVPGSLGAFARDYLAYRSSPDSLVDLGDRGSAPPPYLHAFAIGRDQRWDPVGSLSEYVGGPALWEMAAYAGHFFNHRAGLREKVAAEPSTAEVVLLEETVTERVFDRTVDLPPAAEMAAFDTMEIDVSVTCRYRNPFACSEWDRIARIDYCLDAECGERREIVRWITPYWRRGHRRWIMDASPFLGLLQAGGSQTFRVEMGPSWERKTERDARVALRLRTQGDRPLPRGVELAFRGGAFNAEYNSSREPFAFTRPAEASRVELVAIVTGHGQAEGNNCAEWCDHRHQMAVDGNELPLIAADLAVLGKTRGCAPQTGSGVPPGQWGNWAPGRAYWCPGLPVDLIRLDLSELTSAGEESSLTYRASFAGGEPAGGDIALSAYVVWYADAR